METTNSVFRAYKVKELAYCYNVSVPTFKKWLKPFEDKIGRQIGHFYMAPQIKIMQECIGEFVLTLK